jgi:predicted secreted Zn-dependent protease
MTFHKEMRIATAVLVAGIAGFMWASEGAQAGVKTSTSLRYYVVSGTTTESLARVVSGNPLHGQSGQRSIASLEATFDLSLMANAKGPVCNATDAIINAKFVMTLPQANEAAMTPITRKNWQNLLTFARRHEETHRSIYMSCFNAFVKRAKSLRSQNGCEALKASARRMFDVAMKQCEQQQAGLDAKDSPRLERLPLFSGH